MQSTDVIAADRDLAGTLQCQEGARFLRISSLRIDGGKSRAPVGWTDVYIAPDYADVADIAREQPDRLISALIEERYGHSIAEIQQGIQAVLVSDEMAKRLRVEAGTAALEIVRRYLDAAGKSFEVSVSIHPAERFSVAMRLKRSNP
ncbi:DNA-binding GntR family transcriptional regulator [Paraburkholderia graminis]|uniref:DNA-binding GntR family transcriptional regulator n=1 Tax=Paraburkholderia graminis TaxID=60548 RepID=A0ABD5CFE6_9BURK|nr:DNA-binding GntR family transcriptional regulator [Paraburkholderia graminis]